MKKQPLEITKARENLKNAAPAVENFITSTTDDVIETLNNLLDLTTAAGNKSISYSYAQIQAIVSNKVSTVDPIKTQKEQRRVLSLFNNNSVQIIESVVGAFNEAGYTSKYADNIISVEVVL
jgi:hypothetical protein